MVRQAVDSPCRVWLGPVAGGPPDPTPNPDHDIIVDDFPEHAERLGLG